MKYLSHGERTPTGRKAILITSNIRYMGVYTLLNILSIFVYILRDIWVLLGQLRASRTIHKVLSQSILGTTLR